MKKILVLILLTMFLKVDAFAATSIVINEFQVASPQTVELYNNGTTTIDLSGWYLDDNGGTTYFTIPQGTLLPPNTCASFSDNFGFNTASADSVRLFDKTAPPTATNASLVDAFSYDKMTDTTKSMQRIPDGSSLWSAAPPSFNAFNLTGVPCALSPTSTPTPSPTHTPTPTKTPTPAPTSQYSSPPTYNNVFITEVLPNPKSGQNEWVEIFNNNDYTVSLENWAIDDVPDAGAAPYHFNRTIPPKSYTIIDLPSPMFNNSGDTVRLLDRNSSPVDSIVYATTNEAYTIGRNNLLTYEVCFTLASKGSVNLPCVQDTENLLPTGSETTPTPSPDKIFSSFASISPLPTPQQSSWSAQNSTSSEYTPHDGTIAQMQPEVLGSSQLNPYIIASSSASVIFALLTIAVVLIRMKTW